MTDSNAIEPLKASFRGALSTADSLAALKDYVLALDSATAISPEHLEELGRVTLAHAVASQTLRSMVEGIQRSATRD